MKGKIEEVVREYCPIEHNWYTDETESYTEVGIANLDSAGRFLAHLENEDISYGIQESGIDGWYVVRIY